MHNEEALQFTALDLQKRISEWVVKWISRHPTPPCLGILLYQDLFMLTHSLLGSFQWIGAQGGADIAAMKQQEITLKKADKIIRSLALGEIDFCKQESFIKLYNLVSKTFTIDELDSTLNSLPIYSTKVCDMKSLPECCLDEITVTWDAFSRARLMAAKQAHMAFWKMAEVHSLETLVNLEGSLETFMQTVSGVIITKTMRPLPAQESKTMTIKSVFVIAAPQQTRLPPPWQTAFTL